MFSNPDAQIVMPTVREDVEFSLRSLRLPRAEAAERVDAALDRFGLAPLADRAAHELSSGQKQLLAVCGAFVRRPDLVMTQLLRIGGQAFVSFPNFAQWRIRLAHMFGGRMPVTQQLPHRWYDTPNIHHVTVDDFRAYVREAGITVEDAWFLSGDRHTSAAAANLRAQHAVFLLRA